MLFSHCSSFFRINMKRLAGAVERSNDRYLIFDDRNKRSFVVSFKVCLRPRRDDTHTVEIPDFHPISASISPRLSWSFRLYQSSSILVYPCLSVLVYPFLSVSITPRLSWSFSLYQFSSDMKREIWLKSAILLKSISLRNSNR